MNRAQLLALTNFAIDDATVATTEGQIPTVPGPMLEPKPYTPSTDPVEDALSALEALASFTNLPDPVPDAGSGWGKHTQFLRIADGEAADVIEQLADAVPEAETAKPKSVLEALTKIASAAVDQIKQGLTELSGAAVLKAPKVALARALQLAWVQAESSMAIYRAEEKTARLLLDRVSAEDRAADFRQRLGMFQAIKRLGDAGIVEMLRTRTPGKTTTGIEPVTIALTIAAAAVIVAFAAVLVWWFEIEDRQKNWEAMCLDEKGRAIPEMREICAGLLKPDSGSDWGWGAAIGLAAALAAILLLGRGGK